MPKPDKPCLGFAQIMANLPLAVQNQSGTEIVKVKLLGKGKDASLVNGLSSWFLFSWPNFYHYLLPRVLRIVYLVPKYL